MKAINLKESITLQNISGEAFVLKSDGSLAPLHAGMNINTGTIIVLTDNGTISAIDKAGAPAELFYELIQNIQLPTSYEHIFSVTDENAIDNESIHIAEQTTAAVDDLQKIHDAILNGIDPTKVQQATAAGNENSSNWGVVTIDYDNDKMLAEAGFDTAYQPGTVEYPEDYSGLNDHLSIEASITIDSISQDDVVTAAESNAMQTITGTVGGDVKAGDIVTVTLDGKEIGKATVVNNNGKLEWSLDVDGKTLLQAGVNTVSATVTATDDAGNSATANTTHDYTIDIQASITIDPITGDNVITQQEGHEPTLPITGTVGKDVLPGDTVTVTINGNEYTTTVQPDMSWTVNVTGDDILHADKATASVTTNYGTNHEATATDTESYEVTIEAKVTIETIAGDGVVNQEESEGKVPVTGTVGGDVKEGDTVTITVNGKDYTTTVGKDGSWTVDVDGSDLVENGDNPIHATVTTCDGAGHCATADNDKGYDIDTDINAQITIDSISQDDVVTAAESHSSQTITGTVGGDVKAGDIVTVTLDGKEIGKATVVNNNGKLEWSLDVDGKTLLQAGVDTVSATVTATDDAGNSATANTTHDYTVDIQASITIDPITGDNVITQQEGHEPTLPITGTVGKDVLPGDTVTVTINGNEYTTTVQPDMSWTVNVTGDDILHADKATASVTTNYGTNHEATATDTESYEVTIEAKVTIETIAGDGVVNQEESEGKVPVTGTVGGDVKEGDTVTITVNGKDYTTTVGKDGSWTVDVDGSDLIENGDNPIHATVTTCDGAGHCATANNDKGYDIDTDINADITITVIAEDDVINEAEAEGKVSISGTVGGDVKEGDTVTLTLDGKEIGTATVEKDANGKLVWTATNIDGKTLADADLNQVTASVTATDDAGNSKTATTTHDYKEAVLDVTVDITSVAEDNVLNADESTSTVAIKGTVGGDAKAGDMVTVTLDGKELGTATVVAGENGKLEWTLEVEGSTLAGATVNEVEATITISDEFGNTASDEDKQDYLEKDLTVSVDITSVAEDNVLNVDESTSTVAIKGTVGGDAKAGDRVTVTLDGKELGKATVVAGENDKLEWTLEVEGSTLAGATVNEVEATITISDDYGNTATAEDKQDYLEKDLTVSVDITSVAEDNVLNADESTSTVSIKGTVGGDAKAGDIVTVTLDGKELGTATVVAGENGKLEWTLEVEGSTLAGATVNEVEATITISDDYGNTATAEDKQDYLEKDLTVSVDITSVAEDNVLNADESTSTVAIKGTVGGDAKVGDMVTVTLDGKELGKATVVAGENGKLEWTLEVEGSTLAGATVNEVEATITISDDYGNTATAEDKQDYLEKDLTVSVDITSVAEDNVLNADESISTVAIKGTVDGDAKAGDMVTVTLDGKELGKATVVAGENGKLEWTLEVEGSTLAGATVNEVEATITISDDYGNTATAEDKQDYLEKDLKAEITITSIAGDNALNATEVKPGTMVEIKGTVGGDVKAGDTVVVTVDGVKHEVTVNDDLEWTLEIDGSVLAGAKKPIVTADVVIKDKYGNTASATDKDDYIIPTLDVTITIDSVNGGEPITGEEHDANTPIKVTGSVGGDAKEGDTVTLHIGENTVETTVIVLENGELGYIVDVPAGMFEPDSNDGFSGDITADITINDKYGNTASANDEKDFDTIGSVITGSTSGDDLHGTGYNDLIIGDVYIESKNVNVNLVLDISGSMAMREVNPENIHLDNGHTSGKLTLVDRDGVKEHFDFNSIDELSGILGLKFGSPLGFSVYSPELNITFPDGTTQTINDVYKDIGVVSRIDSAKESINHIVENYGETLNHEQLSNLKFSLITFASQVDGVKEFHWDFGKNTLVTSDGQTIADYLVGVEPLKGPLSQTDYDTSLVAALNGFTNTDTSNIVYFVTDGMDTIGTNGQQFNKDWVVSQTGGNIDKYKPTIVPVAIGGTINNTPEAHDILNQIASLGQGYKPDNSGHSQVIISTNTDQLDDAINNSFDNIISGNDTIHGGKGNDFIVGDTLNNDWLVQQYGSGHTHMADLIDSGVTLSEVLFTVAAKEQGVDIDKLTTKDVYQFVIKHQDTLVIEGDNPSNGLDKIFGDEGQDILFGSGNNDILTGGTGDDLMFGQNGDDILVSDSGSDILFGGNGNDIFKLDVLATDEKTVTSIQDFEKGDSINIESILDANLSLDDLLSHVSSAEVDGKDVNIVFDDKHKVELKDIKNVYSELGTSTSEIVTQLFNNDVFTNHH
ncbi:retention module-containing protein [Photobacterium leiognathi]|uniref:retention module-containing protein n=1 Tax=Photobacterium leiognathi TaxID=553611 RepID=UPI0029812599|nr:retention module-containing protein [Photobacterium leiognathi]